jgi:hypothetical protein
MIAARARNASKTEINFHRSTFNLRAPSRVRGNLFFSRRQPNKSPVLFAFAQRSTRRFHNSFSCPPDNCFEGQRARQICFCGAHLHLLNQVWHSVCLCLREVAAAQKEIEPREKAKSKRARRWWLREIDLHGVLEKTKRRSPSRPARTVNN